MSVETMIDYVLLAMLLGIVASRLIDGLRRGRRCNGACSRAEDGHTISSSVATLAVRRARQASAQRGWRTRRQAAGKAAAK